MPLPFSYHFYLFQDLLNQPLPAVCNNQFVLFVNLSTVYYAGFPVCQEVFLQVIKLINRIFTCDHFVVIFIYVVRYATWALSPPYCSYENKLYLLSVKYVFCVEKEQEMSPARHIHIINLVILLSDML